MTGRKRHLLVDTLGLILAVVIIAASVQDRDGGRKVLEQVPEAQYPELLTVFADAGYQSRLEAISLDKHALDLVIVPKTGRAEHLCGAAEALGGRAHLRLAHALPPAPR